MSAHSRSHLRSMTAAHPSKALGKLDLFGSSTRVISAEEYHYAYDTSEHASLVAPYAGRIDDLGYLSKSGVAWPGPLCRRRGKIRCLQDKETSAASRSLCWHQQGIRVAFFRLEHQVTADKTGCALQARGDQHQRDVQPFWRLCSPPSPNASLAISKATMRLLHQSPQLYAGCPPGDECEAANRVAAGDEVRSSQASAAEPNLATGRSLPSCSRGENRMRRSETLSSPP